MPKSNEARSSSSASRGPTGVGAGRLSEGRPAPELQRLNALIGRWMTHGETVATPEAPALPIMASDVYQWVPGGRFVVHPAYGRWGPLDVGGVELIGHDAAAGQFRTWFFDSHGNVTSHRLINDGDEWMWVGERVRCTGTLADDGKTIVARHERSDDGIKWAPSMTVRMEKVE